MVILATARAVSLLVSICWGLFAAFLCVVYGPRLSLVFVYWISPLPFFVLAFASLFKLKLRMLLHWTAYLFLLASLLVIFLFYRQTKNTAVLWMVTPLSVVSVPWFRATRHLATSDKAGDPSGERVG